MDEKIKKKLKDGWMRCIVNIEVMGATKDVTRDALKKHIEKMRHESKIEIIREDYGEVDKVENPPKNFKEAFSQVVEVEFVIDRIRNLVNFVFVYGPSSVEVIEPEVIKTDAGEIQEMSNIIASMMHQYASQGMGGIVFTPK